MVAGSIPSQGDSFGPKPSARMHVGEDACKTPVHFFGKRLELVCGTQACLDVRNWHTSVIRGPGGGEHRGRVPLHNEALGCERSSTGTNSAKIRLATSSGDWLACIHSDRSQAAAKNTSSIWSSISRCWPEAQRITSSPRRFDGADDRRKLDDFRARSKTVRMRMASFPGLPRRA